MGVEITGKFPHCSVDLGPVDVPWIPHIKAGFPSPYPTPVPSPVSCHGFDLAWSLDVFSDRAGSKDDPGLWRLYCSGP